MKGDEILMSEKSYILTEQPKGNELSMNRKSHRFKRPPKEVETVSVTQKLLGENVLTREGEQIPTHIVIHEVSEGTGRSPKTYNMEHYEELINSMAKAGRTIGYHYLVGDNAVWQFLEDNVATSHTGTKFGNENSIGIERVICEGVNYEHAIHNQAKLVATLMLKHNIPIENVITHKEMQKRYGKEEQKQNPKLCPGRLLAGFRGNVQDFKNEIKRCLIYGWLFEELLDEETIESIPKIMEIAKQKFTPKKEKVKKIHGLQGLRGLRDSER